MPTRLPVPHRPQQSEAGCLPACVEMVLAYWGVERTQAALAAELGTWSRRSAHAVVVVGLEETAVWINDPAFEQAPISVPVGDFRLACDDMDNRVVIIWPKS